MANKSLLFTCLSCIGVAVTAFLAAYEGKKSVKEPVFEEDKDISKPKKAWKTVKKYKFTFISGGLTVASSVASYVISAKALACMGLTLGGVIANRDALQKSVYEATGEEHDDVRENIMTDTAALAWRPNISVEKTGFGDTLCYFAWSGRWFESSEDAVTEQLRLFNEDLTMPTYANGVNIGGYGGVADLYGYLHITQDQLGDRFGFCLDYYYDEDDPDRKDGVVFHTARRYKWMDNEGVEHDCDILVIWIDEMTLPIEDYFEY